MTTRLRLRVDTHPRCPFCLDAVAPQDVKQACLTCMAWHHRACWQEHGRCSACAQEDAGRPCARQGCEQAVHGALTKPVEVKASMGLVDLRDLCRGHAVEVVKEQLSWALVATAGVVLLVALAGPWILAALGAPWILGTISLVVPTRGDVAAAACLLSFGLLLVPLAYLFLRFYALHRRLRPGSPSRDNRTPMATQLRASDLQGKASA
jgi:hypothetical protein